MTRWKVYVNVEKEVEHVDVADFLDGLLPCWKSSSYVACTLQETQIQLSSMFVEGLEISDRCKD